MRTQSSIITEHILKLALSFPQQRQSRGTPPSFGHCRDRYGYLTTLVVFGWKERPDDDADGAAHEPSGPTRGPRAWTGHGRVRIDHRRGGDCRNRRAVRSRPEDRLDVQLDGGQPQVARTQIGGRDLAP